MSGFLNADTFTIANTLWRNDTLRASVVVSAEGAVKNSSQTEKSIEELRADLQKLNLPIGWVENGLKDDPRMLPTDVSGWVYKVIGIIFTALAISQGAPFWFDLRNKFVNLRGVGKKPEEKKKDYAGNPVK